MSVRRLLTVSVLASGLLLGCESDTGSSSASVASGDVEPSTDTAGTSGGDVASNADSSSAPEPDTSTSMDVSIADATMGPSDASADAMVQEEVSEPPAEDVSIGDIVVGEGACTNDSDLAVLADFDIAAEQMAIGLACYDMAGGPGQTSSEEITACFIEKLSTDYGFSLECSVCVTSQLMCLQEFCMEACMSSMMSGVTSPECESCIEANGCKSDFVECSGLNPDLFSP